MDQREFDELVRRMAEEATRRRVVGAGLGAAGAAFAAAAGDLAAKAKAKGGKGKKGKTSDTPRGGDGRACIETGEKCRKKKNGKVKDRCADCCSGLSDGKRCICLVDGGACAANADCCNGSCVGGVCGGGPEPVCRELGQQCKNVPGGCCDGLVCGSGQGGGFDVACYVPAGGRCVHDADCVLGTTCVGGSCGLLS